MSPIVLSIVTIAIVVGGGSPSSAPSGAWPSWRGPNLNGVAPTGSYAVEWSETTNIVWKTPLPGQGASTPAVWGDSIFVTCNTNEKNLALCLDLKGKERWRAEVGAARVGKHKKATGSNPSPTTDGTHVFVYFKSGELACFDFGGKLLWEHNLNEMYGKDTLWWDLGTSPVLTSRFVVVAVMQSGPSYLVAFDKSTGKQAWKHDRILAAPEEAAQSYSTPVVVDHAGEETLIVLGADHVTSHDADSGKELWRVGGLNPTQNHYFRSIASPVVDGDVVLAPYSRGTILHAIRMGGSGDVTASHVLWSKEGYAADVPTPVAVDGIVYVCTDKGQVSALNTKTGQVAWTVALPKHRQAYSSSPILADGKIYATREDGVTFVIERGEKAKILSENKLDALTVATPVFTNGKILLRSVDHLYCIGK